MRGKAIRLKTVGTYTDGYIAGRQSALAEKQEQVRNLIWLLENDSSITFHDAIKRCFPDCAEKTKCKHGNEEHICPECEEAEHEKNMEKV